MDEVIKEMSDDRALGSDGLMIYLSRNVSQLLSMIFIVLPLNSKKEILIFRILMSRILLCFQKRL
jgi:hypothetical protein